MFFVPMIVINVLIAVVGWLIVPAACKTAFVQQNLGWNTTSFKDALLDENIDTITFVDDEYALGSGLDEFMANSYRLTRNVTLTGLKGRDTVLDLSFKRAIVHICATCTFRFFNITVAGDRRGNGFQWDFLVGDYGSRVLVENTNKWRIACTATKDWGVVLNQLKRSPLNPGVDKPQSFGLINVTFKGKFFPDSLFNYDVSADAPYVIQEGGPPQGGYSQWGRNVTRLCDVIVPLSCMETKSPDACVNEAMDRVLAAQEAHGPQGARLVAAIVVPIVVAGTLVAIGAVLWVRRHCRQLATAKLLGMKQCCPSYRDPEDLGSTGAYSVATGMLARGWTVSHTLTLPRLQAAGLPLAERVVFGALLGTGSFGRVYKATWGGQNVAVKVIEHDPTSAAAVENEVKLMMKFSHPNIVSALHCVTFQFQQPEVAQQARSFRTSGRTSGSGTGPVRHMGTGEGTSSSGTGMVTGTGTGTGASRTRAAAGVADAPLSSPVSGRGSAPWFPGPQAAKAATATATATAADAPASAECSSRDTTGRGSSAQTGSSGLRKQHAAAGPLTSAAATATAAAAASVRKAETWVVQELCDRGTLSIVVNGLQPLVVGRAKLAVCAAADDGPPDSTAAPVNAVGCLVAAAEPAAAITADILSTDRSKEEGLLARLLLLRDTAAGLRELHEQNVVHGDLNARNVLVCTDTSSPLGMVAKLADLGLARVIKQQKTHRTTQTVGTMNHMPPELLRSGRMAPAGDVYAFGIMMHEVYTGKAPFKKLHYGQFFEAIVLQNLRPPVLPEMPADYATLMQHCWSSDAAARPTTQQLWECLDYMVQVRCHDGSASAAAAAGQLVIPQLMLAPPAPMQTLQLVSEHAVGEDWLDAELRDEHGLSGADGADGDCEAKTDQ